MADGTQSTKRDIYKLNNEATAFRHLTADESQGLGDLLEQLINRVNALLTQAQGVGYVQLPAAGNGQIKTLS